MRSFAVLIVLLLLLVLGAAQDSQGHVQFKILQSIVPRAVDEPLQFSYSYLYPDEPIDPAYQLTQVCSDLALLNTSTIAYSDPVWPAPWTVNGTIGPVLVWSSSCFSSRINSLLASLVPGLPTISYGQVLGAVVEAGYQVYVIGGMVRDFLLGLPANDVDIAFSCNASALADIITAKNWSFVLSRDQTYIVIGDKSSGEYIEGYNVDFSLYLEGFRRDFTMNALYYNYNGGYIVDSCGVGVNDTLNTLLRIPVVESQWPLWLNGDLERNLWIRLFRWFKFRARDYYPADNSNRQFVSSSLQALFRSNSSYMTDLATRFTTEKILDVDDKSCASDLRTWEATFIADVSPEWYKRNLQPVLAQICNASSVLVAPLVLLIGAGFLALVS